MPKPILITGVAKPAPGYEPHTIKHNLQRSATQKSKNTNIFAIYGCMIS